MLTSSQKRLINSKQAFLFDLDGTIANLEQLNYNGMAKALLEFNGPSITFKEFREFIAGRPAVLGMRELLEHKGFNKLAKRAEAIIKHFRQYKEHLLHTNFNENVKIIPGAKTYLKWLKLNHRQVALVTSTVRNFSTFILKEAKIIEFFDVIITANDVKFGKPSSEPYILAMQKLGVTAEESVAFEDSKAGITSAKEAGLLTVGIHTPGLNDTVVKKADIIIENYRELL